MSRKNWAALGCAAFVGAAVAFPAGLIFAGRYAVRQTDGSEVQRFNAPVTANSRKIYSPDLRHDPYVQDQQRKVVESLESQCRRTGERCDLANAARHWLSDQH